MQLPIYCARGRAAHLAAVLVEARRGPTHRPTELHSEVVCHAHQAAAVRAAERVGHPTITPVKQPPGHDPPPVDEQGALF